MIISTYLCPRCGTWDTILQKTSYEQRWDISPSAKRGEWVEHDSKTEAKPHCQACDNEPALFVPFEKLPTTMVTSVSTSLCCPECGDSVALVRELTDRGDNIDRVLFACFGRGCLTHFIVEIRPEPMAEKDYVADGGSCCPFCQSSNINSGAFDSGDRGSVFQNMDCADCKAKWTDDYDLVGYSKVEDE